MKQQLRSLTYDDMETWMSAQGEKSFRTKQLFTWVHKNAISSVDEMTNISKALRDKIEHEYELEPIHMLEKQVSSIDGTAKYLFELTDGNVIESVWMKYKHGNSVCVSSQVGCRMGCTFCASTLGGLVRGLTPGEMLSQIYEIEKDTNEPVSNVIVMGIGEPLDNYDTVVSFIRILSDERGRNLSQRSITVSTCGLVDQMRKLMKEHLQITLAVSLHAPNDEIRREMMPVAKKYSMDELISACRDYFEETGRRITFEYAMVAGVNDSDENARELIKRVKGLNCHINLIPLNNVVERNQERSKEEVIRHFKLALEKYMKNVTIRRELGSDIDAACGQLRKKYMKVQIDEEETR